MNKMDEVLVDDQYPVEINTATAEPGNVAIHSDLHTSMFEYFIFLLIKCTFLMDGYY